MVAPRISLSRDLKRPLTSSVPQALVLASPPLPLDKASSLKLTSGGGGEDRGVTKKHGRKEQIRSQKQRQRGQSGSGWWQGERTDLGVRRPGVECCLFHLTV